MNGRNGCLPWGGIFGDERQWQDLIKKWESITSGEEFHAAEWDIPNPKFRNQYKQLVKALSESKLIGFGAAMCLGEYNRLFPDAVDYAPYYHCFLDVIGHFAHCAGLCLPRGTVNFTFDHNLEVQYHASKLYHFIISKPNWADREFVSDEISYATRKNPKIQAADLWTREVMKYADNTFGPVKRPIRRSLELLRRENRFWIKVYDDSYFESMKARFDKLLTQSKSPSSFDRYQYWIKKRNMQDNTENRMHYLFTMGKDRSMNTATENSEFGKIDSIVGKLLAVPRKELQKREKQYQKKRAKKKKAKL